MNIELYLSFNSVQWKNFIISLPLHKITATSLRHTEDVSPDTWRITVFCFAQHSLPSWQKSTLSIIMHATIQDLGIDIKCWLVLRNKKAAFTPFFTEFICYWFLMAILSPSISSSKNAVVGILSTNRLNRDLKLNSPEGHWRQSLGGSRPHRVFRKKSSDKSIPMFSNIFIVILGRGPKFIVPRAESLRPLA